MELKKEEEEKEGKRRRREVVEEKKSREKIFFRWGLLYRGIMVIAQKLGYKQLKFESRL